MVHGDIDVSDLRRYDLMMVTLTIKIDDEMANRLEREAKQRGTTVDELIAAGAQLLLSGDAYELSDEDERKIEESDAEGERGEVISHEEMMRKLQSLRG